MLKRMLLSAVALLAAAPLLHAAIRCSVPPFPTVTTYPGISAYRSAVFADVNGDGIDDVISPGAQGLGVGLGRADGTFTPMPRLGSDALTQVVAADLNGDGLIDVAGTGPDNLLLVYLGNGDGTFRRSVIAAGGFNQGIGLAVGDFDGDHHLDVAVIENHDPGRLSIFHGNGDGTFAPPTITMIASYPGKIVTADFDGDGKLDLAIAHAATNQLDVFRGNGDGTFATPTHPTAASAVDGDVPDLVAVDLTGDGKPDLLATTNRENTIAVLINRGDGTFPAPVAYSTNIPNGATVIVVPGDLSGRGKIDALVGLLLFPGNGDGTFGTPYAVPIPASVPPYLIGLGMALHDANHDGRLDLIGNNGSYQLVVLLNDCGIAHPVASVTPVISVGQNANVSVSVTGSGATPSGQITVHDGATAAGNGTLDDSGKATLTISGLAAGDHALTAEYSGEANYDPATSAPFTVRVTTATTTTTGSSFTPYAYGSYVFLDVHVTSSTGDTPSGRATLYIDGIVAGSLDIFYPDSNLSPLMDPGIHMLVFSYPGDATHPPSDSQPFPVEVTRGEASAGVFFDTPSVTVGMNGSAHSVVVPNGHGVAPGGTLTFKDGATLLATIPLPTASSFSLGPFLHTGLRSVTVSYSGDSRYQVAESRNVLAVLGTGSLPLEANYIPTQGVQLHFAANVAGAAQYLIMRRGPALNGAFGVIQSFPTPSNTMMNLVDWVPQPDSAYAYGVDAWDAGQQNLLASSPVEPVVATGGFADWTLTSAVTRAQHFTELASGINILRTFAGMPAMTFTDGTPAGGIFVRASHITDLRDALNAARAALGAPPISFSDPILVPGSTPIRTIHVQEIRDAL